jgi:hypothetical protein
MREPDSSSSPKKRTREQREQEYTRVCTQIGHLFFQIKFQEKRLYEYVAVAEALEKENREEAQNESQARPQS